MQPSGMLGEALTPSPPGLGNIQTLLWAQFSNLLSADFHVLKFNLVRLDDQQGCDEYSQKLVQKLMSRFAWNAGSNEDSDTYQPRQEGQKPKLYKETFVALISVALYIADNPRTLKSQDLSIMEMTMTTWGELLSLWEDSQKHELLFSVLKNLWVLGFRYFLL